MMVDIICESVENYVGHEVDLQQDTLSGRLTLTVPQPEITEVVSCLNGHLGFALLLMQANLEDDRFTVTYLFADRDSSTLLECKTHVEKENPIIFSIAGQVHAASLYEREIKDLYGIVPLNHPNPKRLVLHENWPENTYPMRAEFVESSKPPFANVEIPYQIVTGSGVYQVPVGPVHAGIIEPGHFRFSVAGEPIINLEAQLYYVHKGIEKQCEGKSIEKCFYIAERISGDETFANALAYCQAVEDAAGHAIPLRSAYTRVIFAEIERLTAHLGDLGGMCLDTAYNFATYQFRMLRGWTYWLAEKLCGSRFLRSVCRPGGVRRDFIANMENEIVERLKKIRCELNETADIVLANGMFVDRIENTGILTRKVALDLNAVGPAARASGLAFDVRKNFPYAAYDKLDVPMVVQSRGDIDSRFRVKLGECITSIDLIIQAVENMPSGEVFCQVPSIPPGKIGIGLTEAPRGENIHRIITGENDTLVRYKIRTPSFCNWPALIHAVNGNILPDFPLINKSFNLSYAGNDL
jgi:Ni,Fe-hydrogenase III large subunit/Ni,Fe-hydrogenase III component G